MKNVMHDGCGRWSQSPFVRPRNCAGRHATSGPMPHGEVACRQGSMEMTPPRSTTPDTVGVQVELFNMARLVCGRSLVELDLPCDATLADVARALVVACPALRGVAITLDGTGLLESYTLNLNGRIFVTDRGVHLQRGDTLLLFSSQA